MGAPSYTISVNIADSDASPSWVTMDTTNDRLIFCNTGGLTADQTGVANITKPTTTTTQNWADELWLYDASNTPNYYRKIQSYKKPDNATQRQKVIRVVQTQIDDVVYHYLTAFDAEQRELSGSYVGTPNFNYPLIKLYHSTSGSPSQYWGQGSDSVIKQKNVSGDSNPNGVKGNTNYVTFSLNAGATEYFCISSVIAGDMVAKMVRLSVVSIWA